MRPVADINLKDQHYLSIISLRCNKMKRNKELYLCSPVEQLAKALSAMKHNEVEVVLSWSSILGLQLLNTSLLTVSEPQEQKKKNALYQSHLYFFKPKTCQTAQRPKIHDASAK